jgi:hypothetical protein
MPILDLQKRSRELGRIRLGQKGSKGQPEKLDRFRFTTNSEALIAKVAELYGGQPREWEGGTQRFELISDATRVPIMVPPQPVTQWFETWSRAGCLHRCDGYTNVLTDEPCDPEDPNHKAAIDRPTTRLNVVLRDAEGVGVWRVESHGWNAAVELPDVAEFLAQAGGYVNGWLSLEQRTSVERTADGPKTRHYMVPIIEIDVTPAQLMAGGGRVAAPALAGGPVGATPALAAAGPDYVYLAADLTDAEAVRDVYRQASRAGHLTESLSAYLQQRVADIEARVGGPGKQGGGAAGRGGVADPSPAPAPDGDGVVDGELVEEELPIGDDDPDVIWQHILVVSAAHGMSLGDLLNDFPASMGGLMSDTATAAELAAYLRILEAREDVTA